MFEKSLQDVVKGIRANKRDPSDYISATIAEIKVELRSSDAFIKAQAIRKLTYLQMLGYDMSWAAFYVIEVMTMPRFAHKRVGYLAANQCFTEDTEVVLLCTNHLQKEFKSQNPYDVGLAINCLANIATPGLSRDLISDLVQLLGNHKPYVRKKALLAMYKLFIKYPQGLRLTFDRIKERLEDSDSSVVSCAVNVICELADKNPKNYLAMAPQFFRLLTTSSNNWMLIKVVKLLGSLVPEEPRLARKLLEPLATIIQNTAAKSLLYECIHTMTLALPFTRKADGTESKAVPAAVRLCSEHLRKFTEDPDQNLKYLGLVGFVNLMRSHPRAVAEHRALVLACLSDDDITIRTRALELLTGMVTKRNLEDLVLNLLQHVARAEGTYRDELIAKIILVCSRDKYAYLSNFRWYTGVLIDLSRVEGSKHGDALALQLTDVSLRVEEVREYALHKSVGLLLEPSLISGRSCCTMKQVLGAAAWIVGEYCRPHLETVARNHRRRQRVWFDIMQALLAPEASALPPRTQAVYVQNALKVLIAMCQACPDDGELGRTLDMVPGRLRALMQSPHMEVQERASTVYHLLVSYSITKEAEDSGEAFQPGEGGTANGTGGGGGSSSPGGGSDDDEKLAKEMKGKGAVNGQAAAPPVVLDLLGMDPSPSDGGAAGDGGGAEAVANGKEGTVAPGAMLTSMALVPSMMGPVGAARGAASEMAALCGEVLKPVNQRAQGRVPPPDDVDLEQAVDGSALDRLLRVEYDGPTDLTQLSFTQVRLPKKSEHEEYRVFGSAEKDGRGSGKRGKKSSRKQSKKSSRSRSGSPDNPLNGGGGGGGGMLMLGGDDRSSATTGSVGAGSPLANGGRRRPSADDSFDDDFAGGPRGWSKGRKGKKDKGGKRGRGAGRDAAYAVDKVEMMPASAIIDSEDDDDVDEPAGSGSRGGGRRRISSRGGRESLAAIDITTPLEEDEVMPEVKPYVRLTAEMAKGSEDAPRSKDAKQKKKKKNSREEEATPQGERSSKSRKASSDAKRKSSRKGDTAAAASPGADAEVDLIGWGAGEAGPGLAAASPKVPPVAPAPAGTAMRAPPPASMGTWESDLSAILSADAPPVAAAPVTGVWGSGGGGSGAAAGAAGATNQQLLEDLGGVVVGAKGGRRRSDKDDADSSRKGHKGKSSKKKSSSSSKPSSRDKKKKSRG
ncbi:Coatomer protein complex,delta sub-unit [Ectocarpus siliculosus]|uniref:AP-3 complex subunit delta n=1 Tax=Ectocarpus siliculosus TaxID=2880 RepID=D7FZK5_ECTSI|nr:Coatomer protein complex,delta sub-unit [Ectocarpus siliculosus]|eukprot:CBJ32812.1 Coatomer protein complex,delta sub-unit [Ectocarpus siliculosus]